MQSVQHCVIKASINTVKMLDKGVSLDQQLFECGALLGQSKVIYDKRKESHKNDIDPILFLLPHLACLYILYCTENDINTKSKYIQDMSRIEKIDSLQHTHGDRCSPCL